MSDYPLADPEEEDRGSGPNGKLQVAIGFPKILVRTPPPPPLEVLPSLKYAGDKNTFANIEDRSEMQLVQKMIGRTK